MTYLTYGPADMYETITIGEHGTVSKIHNHQHGWTISMTRDYIPATLMGQPFQLVSAQAEYTLDLEYLDVDSVHRLMDLCDADYRGRPVFSGKATMRAAQIFSASGIRITEAEAIDIANNGVHPLEALLGPSGATVRAVPVDLRALASEVTG